MVKARVKAVLKMSIELHPRDAFDGGVELTIENVTSVDLRLVHTQVRYVIHHVEMTISGMTL